MIALAYALQVSVEKRSLSLVQPQLGSIICVGFAYDLHRICVQFALAFHRICVESAYALHRIYIRCSGIRMGLAQDLLAFALELLALA